MPNDISTTPPSNAPASASKPITIDVLKTNAPQDLRSVFLALGEALNITTGDFFYKLGDLMISNQSFSTSAFVSRFLNLVTQYSRGVVYEKLKGGAEVVADFTNLTNPDARSIKKATAFAQYVASTGNGSIPEKDETPFDDPVPTGRTASTETPVSIKYKDSKDVLTPVDLAPDIDKIVQAVLAKASRTGTTNNIEVFLYNTIPYIAGGALSGAAAATGELVSGATGVTNILNPNMSSLTTGDLLGGLVSGVSGIANGLVNPFIYFTPAELIYFAAANFYTIMFYRGITIKDFTTGPYGAVFNPELSFLKPNVIIASNKSTATPVFPPPPDFDNTRKGIPANIESLVSDFLNNGKENNIAKDNIERSKTNVDIDLTNARDNTLVDWDDDTGHQQGYMTSLESRIGDYKGLNSIGCIYIWPVDKDIGSPTIIPFEFNPTISESAVDVRYQNMTILSRVGDLQSYTSTGSLNVTVTTPYFALSELDNDQSDQLQYLSYFSLQRLQKIELGYRSLTLPFFSDQSSIETGYRYVRPPLVKVIMGDYNAVDDTNDPNNTPFSNLLRYPSAVIGDIFGNIQGIKFRSYRTFICTSVKIGKELDNTPLYIKNNMIKDTMGFTVELALVEVAPSYVDALPSFANFYNNAQLTQV